MGGRWLCRIECLSNPNPIWIGWESRDQFNKFSPSTLSQTLLPTNGTADSLRKIVATVEDAIFLHENCTHATNCLPRLSSRPQNLMNSSLGGGGGVQFDTFRMSATDQFPR